MTQIAYASSLYVSHSTFDCLDHVSLLFQKYCGLPITTYFSAVKLKWLIDNSVDVRKAIHDGRCLFGTVDSWLVWVKTANIYKNIVFSSLNHAKTCQVISGWRHSQQVVRQGHLYSNIQRGKAEPLMGGQCQLFCVKLHYNILLSVLFSSYGLVFQGLYIHAIFFWGHSGTFWYIFWDKWHFSGTNTAKFWDTFWDIFQVLNQWMNKKNKIFSRLLIILAFYKIIIFFFTWTSASIKVCVLIHSFCSSLSL